MSTNTMELIEDEIPAAENEFDLMTAGEWLDRAGCPEPKMLLGELWGEGEFSVLFGDPSSGIGLLAVQIAESIARGRPVAPFEMTAAAQKVLLFDPGRSASQFARQYAAESEPNSTQAVKRYEFSPDLIRVSLKRAVQIAPAKLAAVVKRTGARVLIIDSLAYLQRYSLPRETVVVMRELRRLQKRFGLSILLLMNTSRIVHRRGIVAADIPCSSVVTGFADNVFAVGRSGSRSTVRYIKQIKNCLEDTAYGAAHVPYFAIVPRGGVFPSFEHIGYASETAIRAHDNDHWEWQRIRNIKNLAEQNKTIREIAAELEMSSSTVHRLLAMAGDAPPLPSPSAFVEEKTRQFVLLEKCIVDGCFGCKTCNGRPASDRNGVPGTLIRGHDGNCPDDCDICGPRRYKPEEADADPSLFILSAGHYEALRDWLLAGKRGPRPVYPGARRYGHQKANWKPGSENWTDEQLEIYDRWVRTAKRGPEPDFNPRAGP